MLLERKAPLAAITEAYRRAVAGGGRTILIAGEAGIGKTALIDAFVDSLPATVRTLRGGCEALFAARPLGPLFDVAQQLDGRLLELLQSGADNHRIYSDFLGTLSDDALAGAVFVVEDLHWADNATMDFLKFIGRRIQNTHCLLLATYRDDETGPGHPLRQVLGDLPPDATERISLAPLSAEAIAELGDCDDRRARKILEVTGGTPFFVQELLASRESGVPRTVTDAILARAARLSPDARRLLNLVSVVPGRCELFLLESAFPDALELLDECGECGLLASDRSFVTFRHELARLAIEDALPAGQRRQWNAHVLTTLQAAFPDAAARLAHHADMSGNGEAVLVHAPVAAGQAARLGAHREAVALYRQALGRVELHEHERRAEMLENLAYELYVTGRIEDAIVTRRECLELRESLGQPDCTARSLRWLSRLHWFLGKRSEADRYADLALAASEALDHSQEYAMACSNRAQLYMLSSEKTPAVEWARKAIALAEANDDVETLAHALNNLGTALGNEDVDAGCEPLERSLELSLQHNLQEHAARAYTNLSGVCVSLKRYAEAGRYLDAGIAYTADRDLDSWLFYMQGWRARLRLETGDWDGAAEDATAVTRNYRGATLVASPALTVIALLRLRRGDPNADNAFRDAMEAIADTQEIQRFAPLVAAQAEKAWLTGAEFGDVDKLRGTRDWARRLRQEWLAGELTWWLHRLGFDDDTDDQLPEPWQLLLGTGDWSGAAQSWQRLGCPYEAALALAEGGEDAQREALQLFIDLGAEPAAAKLRRMLREKGVRDLPQRPRQSTLANPAGLTNRQLDVLRELTAGLSDSEIATKLFISPRTVGHHVSAILAKLEVQSRTEAAAVARKLGIVTEN